MSKRAKWGILGILITLGGAWLLFSAHLHTRYMAEIEELERLFLSELDEEIQENAPPGATIAEVENYIQASDRYSRHQVIDNEIWAFIPDAYPVVSADISFDVVFSFENGEYTRYRIEKNISGL